MHIMNPCWIRVLIIKNYPGILCMHTQTQAHRHAFLILFSGFRTSLWSPCGSSSTSPLLLHPISLHLPIARPNCASSPFQTPPPKPTWTRSEDTRQAASPPTPRAANPTTTLCQARLSPAGTSPLWIGPRARRTLTNWQTKVGRTVSASLEPHAPGCRTSMIWKKRPFRDGRPPGGRLVYSFFFSFSFLATYGMLLFIQWYSMPLLARRWQ